MKRIFLDIGAWKGDTARAAISSGHAFDKIYCFEPLLDCCQKIKDENYKNVEICEFGLSNETGDKIIYRPSSSKGSSVYSDKFPQEPTGVNVKMVKASDWFKENIAHGDHVVLKLNCEGSECDILDDLIASKEFDKVSAIMVDFDVRKIPSQMHREEETRKMLGEYNIPMFLIGKEYRENWSHRSEEFTHHWLNKLIKV